MAINELEVDVEFEERILNVEVTGSVEFTYRDREKLDDLIPITTAEIDALFS